MPLNLKYVCIVSERKQTTMQQSFSANMLY